MKSILGSIGSIFYKPVSGQQAGWGLILGIVTWIFGDLIYGIAILLILTGFDFLTGLGRAVTNGGVESGKADKILHRMIGYPILIIVLHLGFFQYLPTIPGFIVDTKLFSEAMIRWFNIIPHMVLAVCIVTEMISIVENLAIARVIPKSLLPLLSKIFTKVRIHLEENITEQGDKTDAK